MKRPDLRRLFGVSIAAARLVGCADRCGFETIDVRVTAAEATDAGSDCLRVCPDKFAVAPVEIEVFRVRPMAEMVAENAAEGCARETYGALAAAWMASAAADADIRNTFASIARDELRHAELSWDIAAWGGLPASIYENGLESLRIGISARPPSEISRLAGVPAPEDAYRLWREIRA